ncbi:helix-turn-helix domain-containing protein [Aeromonas jandaei]|uniref:helix-turn-helix domain-containing protein n=1 Tax=Aeromonas jandaei TaxID=650 RepID=UPI00366D30E9
MSNQRIKIHKWHNEIIEMVEARHSITAIAIAFGVNRKTVYRCIGKQKLIEAEK